MKCPIAPTRESGASLTTPMRYALDNLSALITVVIFVVQILCNYRTVKRSSKILAEV